MSIKSVKINDATANKAEGINKGDLTTFKVMVPEHSKAAKLMVRQVLQMYRGNIISIQLLISGLMYERG